MTVTNISTDRDEAIEDCRALLEKAIAEQFDAVMIIGMKDGNVSHEFSTRLSALRALGACAMVQHEILKKWE